MLLLVLETEVPLVGVQVHSYSTNCRPVGTSALQLTVRPDTVHMGGIPTSTGAVDSRVVVVAVVATVVAVVVTVAVVVVAAVVVVVVVVVVRHSS